MVLYIRFTFIYAGRQPGHMAASPPPLTTSSGTDKLTIAPFHPSFHKLPDFCQAPDDNQGHGTPDLPHAAAFGGETGGGCAAGSGDISSAALTDTRHGAADQKRARLAQVETQAGSFRHGGRRMTYESLWTSLPDEEYFPNNAGRPVRQLRRR